MSTETICVIITAIIVVVGGIWAIYKSQRKLVRDAFRRRLLNEEISKSKANETKAYKDALPSDVRTSVSLMASSIKKSISEIHEAASHGTHVGRKAEDFLLELEKESYDG